MVAPLTVVQVSSSTGRTLVKQARAGMSEAARLAWLLCRHGGSGNFQSLQPITTTGPLCTPHVLPLTASPSCWMTWSSLLPHSEIMVTLRWGQHPRSSYFPAIERPNNPKNPHGSITWNRTYSWILCALVWGDIWDKDDGWDFDRTQSTSVKVLSF